MKIAVASGKGGTGKTTVATSLALSLAEDAAGQPVAPPPTYVDCDVEGPNGHLFLMPDLKRRQDVAIQIPRVDAAKCTACGRCAEACQYHAIVVLGKQTLVFDQLCHGCGSCTLVCPEGAITEEPHAIGVLEAGPAARGISFARGVLDVGEPLATPAIRQLKKWAIPTDGPEEGIVILDAPPGTSCPVGRSRARGRLSAAGHRADPVRAARPAPGGRGGEGAGHPGRGDHQPGRDRGCRRGRVLRGRGAADPAAHPVRARHRRGDRAGADAGGDPSGVRAAPAGHGRGDHPPGENRNI